MTATRGCSEALASKPLLRKSAALITVWK